MTPPLTDHNAISDLDKIGAWLSIGTTIMHSFVETSWIGAIQCWARSVQGVRIIQNTSAAAKNTGSRELAIAHPL
jgi:hypothetical protein